VKRVRVSRGRYVMVSKEIEAKASKIMATSPLRSLNRAAIRAEPRGTGAMLGPSRVRPRADDSEEWRIAAKARELIVASGASVEESVLRAWVVEWSRTPLVELGERCPLQVLCDADGWSRVEALLERMAGDSKITKRAADAKAVSRPHRSRPRQPP